MRTTKQRTKILEIVKSSRKHPNAAEIYDTAKEEQPNISMGTVYRNLNILADKGYINKVLINEEAVRFDGAMEHHQHMVCVECGELFDVYVEEFKAPNAFTKDGAKVLKYTIMAECICKDCQQK